jgi:hypothetical protein
MDYIKVKALFDGMPDKMNLDWSVNSSMRSLQQHTYNINIYQL